MNLILITLLAVASLSFIPTKVNGNDLANNKKNNDNKFSELWKENNVHEKLVRNIRGAKNQNGQNPGSGNGGNIQIGKRGKNNKKHNNNNSNINNKNLNEQNHDNNNNNNNNLLLSSSNNTTLNKSSIISPNSSTLSPTLQIHKSKLEQQQHQRKQIKLDQHHHHQSHIKYNQNKNNKNQKSVDDDGIPSQCRYSKGQWTECDPKTNTRSRTLTLKKQIDGCVPTRTIEKKCKKACRYDKGAWSDCTTTGQMSRTDKLKSTADTTCQATRVINKKCNPSKSKDKQGNKERKNKDKVRANNNNKKDHNKGQI